MEVLLMFNECKREAVLLEGSDVLKTLESEFQSLVSGNIRFTLLSETDRANSSERETCDLYVLQRYSAKWDSFIDVTEASKVCNGDKLTILKKQPLKINEVASKTKSLCSSLGKPSEADARVLGSLFPSKAKRLYSKAFSPLDDCVVSKQKHQKKATRTKPRKITVVLMQASETCMKVPRGQKRRVLLQDGYIKQLEFSKNMSYKEVQNIIIRGFSDKIHGKPDVTYLSADPKFHVLTKVEFQESDEANGAFLFELAGQGSLYVKITENVDHSEEIAPITDVQTTSGVQTTDASDAPVDASDVRITLVTSDAFQEIDENIRELPINTSSTQNKLEELHDWRELRRLQDEAFEESLRMDRNKDIQAASDRRKTEAREQLKENLRLLFKDRLQTESSVKFGIRSCDGTVMYAFFQPEDNGKIVYQYVFANMNIDSQFKLYTASIPKQEVLPDNQSLSQYGITTPCLLVVELTSDDVFSTQEWAAENVSNKPPHECKPLQQILSEDEEARINFMKSLRSCEHHLPHEITRATVYDDMVKLYESYDDIILEYPLKIEFNGEQAYDLGGVSRDAISAFWNEAYQKLFDGSTLFIPLMNPHSDFSSLPVLGRVLSHSYLCTGFLPIQIAFPSLVAMLLGPNVRIERTFLIESFLDYISDVDRIVLNEAVRISTHSSKEIFPSNLQDQLLTVLSEFGCRQVPSPSTLSQIVTDIAHYTFLTNPMSAIAMINSGIPLQHRPFWCSKSICDIYKLYQSLTATPAKVLTLLEEPIFINKAQQRVFSFLRQYIGNMPIDEVRLFLRFCTGSTVCTSQKLEIQFNTLSGIGRRPIAHTCSNMLELPATYTSYQEFAKEFKLILFDDTYTWLMDSI